MKRYLKHLKQLERIVVIIMLILSLSVSGNNIIPLMADEGSEGEGELTKTLSGTELLNLNERKPEGYNENSDINPLNISKKEKGVMTVTNNELQVYKNDGDPERNEVMVGDTFYYKNTYPEYAYPLNQFKNSVYRWNGIRLAESNKNILVKSAVIDNGDNKKNNIAYCSYDYGENQYKLWIHDSASGTDKSVVTVNGGSNRTPVFENSDMAYRMIRMWRSGTGDNFLSIAAGDFDGDGQETIVVASSWYTIGENNIFDYKYFGCITEYKYNEDDNSLQIVGEPKEVYNSQDHLEALTISAGDYDGDGCDDLGVIKSALIGDTYSSGKAVLNIYKGRKTGSVLTNKICEEKQTAIENKSQTEVTYAGAICESGDVDGDGIDELVVGGMCFEEKNGKCSKKIETQLLGVYSVIDDSVKVDALGCAPTNEFYGGEENGEYPDFSSLSPSDRTPIYQSSLITVAFSGRGEAETIFFNGSLYNYDSFNSQDNAWNAPVYVPKDLKEDSYYTVSGLVGGVNRISSAVAGNFTEDPLGREIIIYASTQDRVSFDKRLRRVDDIGVIKANYQDSEENPGRKWNHMTPSTNIKNTLASMNR